MENTHKEPEPLEFKFRRMVSFPFRVANKIDKMGWKNTLRFVMKKI